MRQAASLQPAEQLHCKYGGRPIQHVCDVEPLQSFMSRAEPYILTRRYFVKYLCWRFQCKECTFGWAWSIRESDWKWSSALLRSLLLWWLKHRQYGNSHLCAPHAYSTYLQYNRADEIYCNYMTTKLFVCVCIHVLATYWVSKYSFNWQCEDILAGSDSFKGLLRAGFRVGVRIGFS